MKPRKLKLRDGLKWRGHMTVSSRVAAGYVVDWDAEVVGAAGSERHVMDRCVLTAKQIREWTGVDVEAEGSTP